MRNLVLLLVLTLAVGSMRAEARPACPPNGYDRAALLELRNDDWRIEDAAARDAFAVAMVACLASPDPALRDGVAYEALQTLLRGRRLSLAAMNSLYTDLMTMLRGPHGRGFSRPFAALALSEIARADRIDAFLSVERRAALLEAAFGYMTTIEDYRGFDEKQGWRHGVAHGADLLLQLALNPAFGKTELARIRAATAARIAPTNHSYVFGESERLARPVFFMAQRGLFSESEWTAWFADICALDEAAFRSKGGLARRHNLTAFASALFLNARLGDGAGDDALLPGLEACIRALP